MSISNTSVSAAGAAPVQEGLTWTQSELARMQALKHEVFFDAVRELSSRAEAGSSAAAKSVLNAAEVALPEVWLKKIRAENFAEQTLMERIGFVMKHDFEMSVEVVMPVLEDCFRGGRVSGPWDHHQMASSWGGKAKDGLFAEDAPVMVFMANAMHSCRNEGVLLELLQRIGPVEDWQSKFVTKPHFFEKFADWPQKVDGLSGNLIAHAVMADNHAALRALKRWDEATYLKSLESNVCKHKAGYGGNDQSRDAFSFAAISNCSQALTQLLADANAHLPASKVNQLAAKAALDHMDQTGVRGDPDERVAHDRQLGVWDVLAGQLQAPILDRVSDLATEDALNMERSRRAGSGLGPARSDFSLVCDIAIKAVERVHPEAIHACRAAIDHPYALRMGDCSRSMRSEKELAHPFDYAMSSLIYTKNVDMGVLQRVTAAFDDHIRERDMKWGGGDTLRTAAKQNNMVVAMHLVSLGADPAAKDDRGWTAESNFKPENKVAWRAFLNAHKAKQRMSEIAKLGRAQQP